MSGRDVRRLIGACAGSAALFWVIVLPRTAVDVQAGDGAEYAMVAARGTLAHPPGFPIYSLLGELWVAVFPANPYAAMAALSAIFQGLAVAGLAALCFWLCRSALVAGALAAAWGWYEPVLRTGTDAEVFGLHHCLALGCAAMALWLLARPEKPAPRVLLLGLLCGIGGAHQPIIVFFWPLVVGVVGSLTWRSRQWQLAPLLLAGAAVGLLPYLHLFGRWAADPELAFGNIVTLRDLIGHALRESYGVLNIHHDQSGDERRYLGHMFLHLAVNLPVFLAGVGLAAFAAYKARRLRTLLLGATLLSHFGLAAMLAFPSKGFGEVAVRFYGSIALVAALLLADALGTLASTARARWVYVAAALLPVLVALPEQAGRCDARADVRGAVYLAEAFREIPHEAVFITSTDTTSFGALYWQQVFGIRPDVEVVVVGRLRHSWYRRRLRQRLAHVGVEPSEEELTTTVAVAGLAHDAGRAVFAEPIAVPAGWVRQPRGVVVQWYPRASAPDGELTVESLTRFCARWPAEVMAVPLARRETIWAWKGGFVSPLLGVWRNAARRGTAPWLPRAAVAVERGEVDAARAICGAALVNQLRGSADADPPQTTPAP